MIWYSLLSQQHCQKLSKSVDEHENYSMPSQCRFQTVCTVSAWRHGRAWKMKIRAWKNQDPCFNFYKHIYALLHKYPV